MPDFEIGTIVRPNANGCLKEIFSGAAVWGSEGQLLFVGTKEELLALVQKGRIELSEALTAMNSESDFTKVIIPGSADTHTHTFQPEGIPGVLIEKLDSGEFHGWLPETLKFETSVRNNPEMAKVISSHRFREYIEHGITASLEYTTSSIEAARIVLQEAEKAGLGGRIKVGYVAMDQEVDFIHDVALEVKDPNEQNRVIGQIKELAQEFPGQVVIIDRFPIAVSSEYRKKLARLAQDLGALYETHVNESEGEQKLHSGLYGDKEILQVLQADGVFEPGMKVGLAHGIHTTLSGFDLINAARQKGTEIHVRFCPDSNNNLGSHMWNGTYRPMPYAYWKKTGANIALGTDKGAGTGWSVFAEALKERGRPHLGAAPTEQELLAMATVNGLRSLGLNDSLQAGTPASFIVIDLYSPFSDRLPSTAEGLAATILRAGQTPSKIMSVVVNGKRLK